METAAAAAHTCLLLLLEKHLPPLTGAEQTAPWPLFLRAPTAAEGVKGFLLVAPFTRVSAGTL